MSTRARNRDRAAKAAACAIAVSALCALGLSAQAKHEMDRPDRPERTMVSSDDIVLYPPPGAGASFSFLPNGTAQPFDRNLVLSAASGESRSYLVKARDSQAGEYHVVAYVVDKRRPRAPEANPPSGLYYESIRLELKADEGSTIMWAVVGADGSEEEFVQYSKASRPQLEPPPAGSVTRAVLAYSVNKAGIRSYPARFVYRLAERGLPVAQPRDDLIALDSDPSLPQPRIEAQKGFSELSMPLPSGSSFLADFTTTSPPRSIYDFERIDAGADGAKLRIPCPYAWSGEVKLYYGTLSGGKAAYNPTPLTVALSYPAEEALAPGAPPAPLVAADPEGKGGFLAFPAYDGRIYVSLGGGAPKLYSTPLPLSAGTGKLRVSWYGEDSEGRKSAARSGSYSLPQSLRDVELSGAAEGAAISGDVILKPDPEAMATLAARKDNARVHYELRIDGSFPPEPGPASPLLGDSLAISCPVGEERSVVLRYRAISDTDESEGRILRFTLDRKPPEAPSALDLPPAFSEKALRVDLKPGTGGQVVYASVSVDGESAPFAPATSALSLPGSGNGPVAYRIRAYDVDAAGNKSAEMAAISVVVDTTSVYVAENGDDRGEGTPARPYRTMDAAIAAALRGGKTNINMRGSLELRSRVQISCTITFVGGFDEAWAKDGTQKALLALAPGKGALSVIGGELGLRRIQLRADDAAGPVLELEGASLSVSDSSISAGSDRDLVLVSATGSKIEMDGSQVKVGRGMSCTAIVSERCLVSLSSCSVKASKDVRVFCAIDADGGSIEVRQSMLESRSDLGLSLLSLRSASLLVDRSVIDAEGGSGFLRLGLFKSVSGEVRNSKVALAWSGPGTLFETADGGPAFRHDTIIASSPKGPLRFFDCQGKPAEVWNCILDCASPGSDLLFSDVPLPAGALAADCVWGFDALVAGATEAADPKFLNGINALSPLFSSKPIVEEPPTASFDSPIKSESSLKRGSVCIGGALSLGAGYEVDFSGRPRPAPGKDAPDIGADEFFE